MTMGVITYAFYHLKTEQVVQAFLRRGYDLKIYALPFVRRHRRRVLFSHRPEQTGGVHPKDMARDHGIDYIECADDSEIDNSCDVYYILGSGILSAECVEGKQIINCHPGIIPAVRGLDAFKWAVYDMLPMGVTLHYVDTEVDMGEIISIVPTNIYKTDTLDRLARRHYENELDVLSNFEWHIENPINEYAEIGIRPDHKRMGIEKQWTIRDRFSRYIEVMV